MRIPILSINGSDSTGQSGIGADIQTIAALGGYAVTAVTCISSLPTSPLLAPPLGEGSVAAKTPISSVIEALPQRGSGEGALPADLVLAQVAASISTLHPKAIKVGLVTDSETVRLLRGEVIACRRLVVAPGIFDAEGRQMVSDDVIEAFSRYLVPEALLLMLRCRDAEKMLGISIKTDDDMLGAARLLHEMGAEWVLLRGARHIKGRLIALLYSQNKTQFFSSYNTEGWQRHGVAGALSAAITTRLGMGDDVPTAVRNAHDFIHSQVVYAKPDETGRRAIDIHNNFVSLVAEHYRKAHDVAFYADRLCITTRYLSQVTDNVVGKSPKQIIADYIMSEAKTYLGTTRLTIQEVADRLGFSSQALFCKFFKSQEKTSPSEYRNK